VIESILVVVRVPRAIALPIAAVAILASCFASPAIAAWLPSSELRARPAAIPGSRGTNGAFLPERDARSSRPARGRDWDAELAALNGAPAERRLAVLLGAAESGYDLESTAGRTHYAEIRRIAGTLAKNDPLRGRALLIELAMESPPPDEERLSLRALLEDFRDASAGAELVKGRIALALAPLLPSSPERLRALLIARDAMRGRVSEGNVELAEAWSMLAAELAMHDASAAEAEWKALVAWHSVARPDGPVSRMMREAAEASYMQFLMQRNRLDEAESLVRPSVDSAMAEAVRGNEIDLRRALAKVQGLFWIAITRRDTAHAARWLDAWADASSGSADLDPQLALARLALADLRGDAGGVSDARERLASLVATTVLCESGAIARATHPGAARARELVERYGVCRG